MSWIHIPDPNHCFSPLPGSAFDAKERWIPPWSGTLSPPHLQKWQVCSQSDQSNCVSSLKAHHSWVVNEALQHFAAHTEGCHCPYDTEPVSHHLCWSLRYLSTSTTSTSCPRIDMGVPPPSSFWKKTTISLVLFTFRFLSD